MLAEPFPLCSFQSVELERLSSILQGAPAWIRFGLTVRDDRLRERAADAMAATIIQRLKEPAKTGDRDQLPLPL